MEFVVNAMPAYFSSDAGATMALVRGLLRTEDPMTYERMFANIDRAQVVLVTGEQDNVYVPGGGGGGEFTPVREQTSAGQGQTLAFSTAMAPAGKYVVKLAHDTAHPGGDADLYVRVGAAPTESTYDCRPYDDGSNELCAVTLAAPARIFVNVKGYAAGENHFVLTIDRDGATPPPGTWTGIDESGTVTKSQEKRWQTPSLPAGAYLFQITGQGDADLYVRTGVAPTTSSYECRPYKSGSNESCLVNLTVPAPIHVMVRGYAASSSFRLVGKVQ